MEAIDMPINSPVTSIFVGNIDEKADNEFVESMLEMCGKVVAWKRMTDGSGNLQGFGLCDFEEPEATLRALRVLNEFPLGDKKLIVKVEQKHRDQLKAFAENESGQSAKPNSDELPASEESLRKDENVRLKILEAIEKDYPDLVKDEVGELEESGETSQLFETKDINLKRRLSQLTTMDESPVKRSMKDEDGLRVEGQVEMRSDHDDKALSLSSSQDSSDSFNEPLLTASQEDRKRADFMKKDFVERREGEILQLEKIMNECGDEIAKRFNEHKASIAKFSKTINHAIGHARKEINEFDAFRAEKLKEITSNGGRIAELKKQLAIGTGEKQPPSQWKREFKKYDDMTAVPVHVSGYTAKIVDHVKEPSIADKK